MQKLKTVIGTVTFKNYCNCATTRSLPFTNQYIESRIDKTNKNLKVL